VRGLQGHVISDDEDSAEGGRKIGVMNMADEQQLIGQLEELIAGIKDGTRIIADAQLSFTPQRIKDISDSPAIHLEATQTAELVVKWQARQIL